ncbi:MAG: hypothetical protein H6R10_3519 [Rhodocyclaceae bacterium]|nr:hypothetical protein [Rhodocyclaceae bacterium]
MIYAADPNLWMKFFDRPVEQRLATAPEALVDFLAQHNAANGVAARPQAISAPDDFLIDLHAAISEIPAPVKAKLEPCLLGVFLATGIGASAITDVVASSSGVLLGCVVAIDVDAFRERKANEWATWKENTPFHAVPGTQLAATIAPAGENDRKTALQFLLLHEFGHVLTAGKDLAPEWWLAAGELKGRDAYRFLPLSWDMNPEGAIVPQPDEDFPLRSKVMFYQAPQLSGDQMLDVYPALEQTSFPTLYAATSIHEDFAECFATYVHTVLLGKPYQVDIFRNGQRVFSLEDFWATPRSRAKRVFMEDFFLDLANKPETPFLGLAPFLRMSIAGGDLRGMAERLLVQANQEHGNANLWMNLSIAFLSLGLQDLGLSIQEQALLMQRLYTLRAARQPARFRLLMLMAPGDLAENTPLDCLLEDSDVELVCYYVSADAPLPTPLPEHDALLVAISDKRDNGRILQRLESLLANWPKPVINLPRHIPNTDRSRASHLLQGIPGLAMPLNHRLARAILESVAAGETRLEDLLPDCAFPIIIRPVGSQAGRDLAKLAEPGEIAPYLEKVGEPEFFVARFVDYSSSDGLFRKYRVALLRGRPFACHMGISAHWMIHYVNAGMYEDAAKRAEEARFMENFDFFAQRHGAALESIHQRFKLDYVCIDCAETRAGELLIFEIDHIMVVHAMDSETMFPFKKIHMGKLQRAFEHFLYQLPTSQAAAV